MPALDAVRKARAILSDVTPLSSDCGRLCAAACCRGDEETGMLLFPEEERLFEGCAFGRVIPARFSLAGRPALLFVCRGGCARARRPLACRFFPLLPEPAEGGVRLRMDPRGAGVCPLYRSGARGLSPAFREAARRAAEALCEDEACAAWLRDLRQALSL